MENTKEKFRIGETVVIDPRFSNYNWYSSTIYTVMAYEDRSEVVILNKSLTQRKNLPLVDTITNRIHQDYLSPLSKIRKQKLKHLKKNDTQTNKDNIAY